MDFTIVIPTLGSSKFLGKTLAGIDHSFEDLVNEIILVVNSHDSATLKSIAGLEEQFEFEMRIIRTEQSGQHPQTLLGIVAATNDLVITMDDDVVINDEGFKEKLVSNLPADDEMIYVINQQFGLADRVKMVVVSLVIRYISNNSFKTWKGSSLRVINKRLFNSRQPIDQRYIYIDALLPFLGYRVRTLSSSYEKIKHDLKRYTVSDRFSLLWRSLINYR